MSKLLPVNYEYLANFTISIPGTHTGTHIDESSIQIVTVVHSSDPHCDIKLKLYFSLNNFRALLQA